MASRRLSGFTGSEVLAAEFTIHNRSSDAIVVERVEVIAGVSRLHSAPLDDVTRRIRPRASARLTTMWRFDQPVVIVLEQSPQLQFTLSLEQREVFIALDYERVR